MDYAGTGAPVGLVLLTFFLFIYCCLRHRRKERQGQQPDESSNHRRSGRQRNARRKRRRNQQDFSPHLPIVENEQEPSMSNPPFAGHVVHNLPQHHVVNMQHPGFNQPWTNEYPILVHPFPNGQHRVPQSQQHSTAQPLVIDQYSQPGDSANAQPFGMDAYSQPPPSYESLQHPHLPNQQVSAGFVHIPASAPPPYDTQQFPAPQQKT